MKNKTTNTIFKVIYIAIAILSFAAAIGVWFFNLHVSTFSAGCNYLIIAIAAIDWATRTQIKNTKNNL